MANLVGDDPITINAEGIIATKNIWVRKVRFLPGSTGNQATFTYWIEGTPDHESTGTCTWSTLTLTSTGNLAAGAPAANDIFKIFDTSTGNNEFYFQTATAGDNNDAVFDALAAHHGTVTDEASKTYFWKIWTPKTAFKFDADGTTNKRTREIDFGDMGFRFPNLAVHTLSGGVEVEIFVR